MSLRQTCSQLWRGASITGTEGRVRVFQRQEGEPIDFRGAKIWRNVTREDTGARWAFGESENDPGLHNTPHTHTEPEGFYVLEGEYTFYTEGEPRAVGAHSFVFIPPDTRHGFIAGPHCGRLLCLWPAAFDGYFWAMKEAFQQHGEDPEVLAEVAPSHGMVSLPVPPGAER